METEIKNLRKNTVRDVRLALGCLLFALLLSSSQVRAAGEALASQLAPEILRFHILANSNSQADQQVKLEVRSLLLDLVAEGMELEAEGMGPNAGRIGQDPERIETGADGIRQEPKEQDGKTATAAYILAHRSELEAAADRYLADRGFPYQATLSLTQDYFPTRAYGDMIIPCGTYDAVRMVLGKGAGHNWWCILYPRLCFVDAACKEVPEESRSLIGSLIKEDGGSVLTERRPEIRFQFGILPYFYSTAAKPITPQS